MNIPAAYSLHLTTFLYTHKWSCNATHIHVTPFLARLWILFCFRVGGGGSCGPSGCCYDAKAGLTRFPIRATRTATASPHEVFCFSVLIPIQYSSSALVSGLEVDHTRTTFNCIISITFYRRPIRIHKNDNQTIGTSNVFFRPNLKLTTKIMRVRIFLLISLITHFYRIFENYLSLTRCDLYTVG